MRDLDHDGDHDDDENTEEALEGYNRVEEYGYCTDSFSDYETSEKVREMKDPLKARLQITWLNGLKHSELSRVHIVVSLLNPSCYCLEVITGHQV